MDVTQILFVLGAGVLCAGWVVVQQVVARLDPEQPGVEGGCRSCGPPDKAEIARVTEAGSDAESFSV